MHVRRLALLCIFAIFMTALFLIGCDELITENNTTIVYDSTIAVDCFNCHSDYDNNLLRPKEQFKNSAHANFELLDAPGMECGKTCHTHEGFLGITTSGANAINCFTCHLPHSGEYGEYDADTLRMIDTSVNFKTGFKLPVRGSDLGKSNNCGHCHKAANVIADSVDVALDSTFGPHFSPQADVLTGKTGYFINPTTPEANSHEGNGCIKCHYGTDLGDGQGYLYAEHTFRLENDETSQQYLNTCNAAAPCHGGDLLDFYSDAKIATIDTLAEAVQSYLEDFGLLDPADTSGLTFLADSANVFQARLLFNYLLYKHDNSRGIHNINFVTKLLDTTKVLLDSLPPIVDFFSDIQLSCASDLITFTPIVTGDYDSLLWSFGTGNDSITYNEDPVARNYNEYGTFDVNLTAFSSYTESPSGTIQNASGEFQQDGYIIVDTTPVAEFGAQDGLTTICVNDSVVFLDSSISLAGATYSWSTGVGSLDSSSINVLRLHQQNPIFVFDTIGTFSISLITETACGADTIVKTDYVTVDGAIAQIGFSSVDTTFTFTSNSIGIIDSIQWDIDGDNVVDSTRTAPFDPIVVEYARGLSNIVVTLQVYSGTCVDNTLVLISTPTN